jgi:hypothetical protein
MELYQVFHHVSQQQLLLLQYNILTMASKVIISIKLTVSGPNVGPFDIIDAFENVLASDISKEQLVTGTTFFLDDDQTFVILKSKGDCNFEKIVTIKDIPNEEWQNSNYVEIGGGCIWTHLKNEKIYNYFYGNISPYIIEYPFSYNYNDEILQNVKDYSEVYTYLTNENEGYNNNKVQIDNKWFNKAVLYNGQQSSGILELVPKPKNDLSSYMKYPILNKESKTITFTKSDSFYQYNTFWALEKDNKLPMFNSSCKSLSLDKEVNQSNMNYGKQSFKKSPLRAKDLKVRHILDNSSTTLIVSQFIITPSQISYK